MIRLRILQDGPQEVPSAHRGEEVAVDGKTGRALIARGAAERIIDRSPEIERG